MNGIKRVQKHTHASLVNANLVLPQGEATIDQRVNVWHEGLWCIGCQRHQHVARLHQQRAVGQVKALPQPSACECVRVREKPTDTDTHANTNTHTHKQRYSRRFLHEAAVEALSQFRFSPQAAAHP